MWTTVSSVTTSRPERNKMPKIQVNCQVVGNAVRKTFTLVVLQAKGELWRAAIDSHLLLEVSCSHSWLLLSFFFPFLSVHSCLREFLSLKEYIEKLR